MEKKTDRRIVMTKRMLKEALIEMLKEKDIYHVSIRELCEKADINRTTFYKYYGSQFDLLTDMENDLLDFIAQTVSSNEDDPEIIVCSACKYLEDNIEFARLIINNNVDPDFPQKVFAMDSIKNSAIKKFRGSKSESELEYIYGFLTYGAYRMVCEWLNKEKREPPEEFAKLVSQMLLS